MSDSSNPTSVRVNEIEIFFERHGEGDPLLLLHGMGGCAGDWKYAGRDELARHFELILPDARGHGRSTGSARDFTHRQGARDVLALLDQLEITRCRAIGLSMGGNTLLHLATLAKERVEAMVLVSAAPYFPEQARRIMRGVSVDGRTEEEWQSMRERHTRGDEQIRGLWQLQRELAESYDDMNFTPPILARIEAETLIVYGDRDPLYPVELGLSMYRALPRAAFWAVPGGGHAPIFSEAAQGFVEAAIGFFGKS